MMSELVGGRGRNWWRILAWSAAAGLILLPLVAMRFTTEVNWSPADFVFAIVMIGGVGLLFDLAVRLSSSIAYRGGVALALLAMFLLIWVNLAVGIIGSEDDPANLIFAAVPTVTVGGAIIAHFRAAGMMWTAIAAAVAQAGVAVVAFAMDIAFIFPITAMFCGVWMIAAWLFARAR